ncbi:TetR family transcriptional regulator C-terminal domain-containing protein [Ketogulonicigenium vulgare]|uniref:TetR family transcriptional regulator n=1 Tax=Ketogulonicigenium vulgare (strain WSH-001) TaxID=759362 RepID=F9Y3B7_KETVW|nr:TetR family transcriptional regulator C-terminal domain-containing protein [Ketogulonicigenium vulgare]AEM40358.1 TetR family transcriptional regulator [Ketogulonicigenium vulgare WSH-001]ALJ82272.1 TetR family transcriptional regulator [Ketogulonicigenium vulgare]ANW34942.1 TetR family transcriptional regulator [Ketogulonicigenium vulgare]
MNSPVVSETTPAPKRSRIQRKNRALILKAGLEVFSQNGFRGATVDMIAQVAGLSKPNLLYYFHSKEEIYTTILADLLVEWLNPFRMLDPNGDPMDELMGYIRAKLAMARDFPQESRLFATEVIQGAPHIKSVLETDLRELVEAQSAILSKWMDEGRIARMHPVHLIITIWALTQHYADFDAQTRAILSGDDPFPDAAAHLELLFRKLLTP